LRRPPERSGEISPARSHPRPFVEEGGERRSPGEGRNPVHAPARTLCGVEPPQNVCRNEPSSRAEPGRIVDRKRWATAPACRKARARRLRTNKPAVAVQVAPVRRSLDVSDASPRSRRGYAPRKRPRRAHSDQNQPGKPRPSVEAGGAQIFFSLAGRTARTARPEAVGRGP